MALALPLALTNFVVVGSTTFAAQGLPKRVDKHLRSGSIAAPASSWFFLALAARSAGRPRASEQQGE